MKRTILAVALVFGSIGLSTAPAQAAAVNSHACENAHARAHNKHCPHKRFDTLADYLAWIRQQNAARLGTVTLTGWTR